jgi:hypothetical protein
MTDSTTSNGDLLGPSDSSDSGSDMSGTPRGIDAAGSDSAGTGERRSADGSDVAREAADIAPDRVVTEREREVGGAVEDDEGTNLDLFAETRGDALPDDDLPGEDGPGEDEPGDDKPGDPRRDEKPQAPSAI